eukprot:scaffold5583_cov106-Isochrysis_galbana.AAC.1
MPGTHAGGTGAARTGPLGGVSAALVTTSGLGAISCRPREKSRRGPTSCSNLAAAREAARSSRAARECVGCGSDSLPSFPASEPEPACRWREAAADAGRALPAVFGGEADNAAARRPDRAMRMALSLADGLPRCSTPPAVLGRCLVGGVAFIPSSHASWALGRGSRDQSVACSRPWVCARRMTAVTACCDSPAARLRATHSRSAAGAASSAIVWRQSAVGRHGASRSRIAYFMV